MAEQDGNGWVDCGCGSRHWGRHGAAGLVLLRDLHREPAPRDGAVNGVRPPGATPPRYGGSATGSEVLLQLRAAWTHQGGSWGLPGGARDSHEDPVATALREAAEEAGVDPATITVLGQFPGVDHGDWSYVYVVARAGQSLTVAPATAESDELRWVALDAVQRLPLHPAFGDAWPRLHARLIDDVR